MRRLAVVLVAAVSGAPAAAPAETERNHFSLQPSLTLTFEASDNGQLALEGTDGEWGYGAWIEPRLAVEVERARWRGGADLGADLRYSVDRSELRDAFLDLRGFVELELARGLTLKVADSFVPQSVRLGSPPDDLANLRQSNRLLAELAYTRELDHGRAFEFGVAGERFDGQGFEAALDFDADGIPDLEGDLHPDYWGGSAHIELQQGIGRQSLVYLRGELRERRFDELPRSDFVEWSSLVGLRRNLARRLELDVALGWGSVEYDQLPSNERFLGRASIDYAMPRGWELQGLFVQRFTSDAAGFDFNETTARLGLSKRLGARNRAGVALLWSQYEPDSPTADPNQVWAFDANLERQLTRRVKGVLSWRQWRNRGSEDTDDLTQNRVTLGFTYAR